MELEGVHLPVLRESQTPIGLYRGREKTIPAPAQAVSCA